VIYTSGKPIQQHGVLMMNAVSKRGSFPGFDQLERNLIILAHIQRLRRSWRIVEG